MRTVLLSKADEDYLGKCAYETDFAYGIIIGQHAEPTKDIVVHLAKNCEEDVDLPISDDQAVIKVEDINTQALTNQWVSANKMIPGSFNILGVFATSVNPKVVSEETFKAAKKILYDIHHLLISANSLINSVDDPKENELIFLAFTPTTRNIVCKSYETNVTNGGKFSKLDVRIVEKPFEWYRIECTYELNDVFPILEITPKINIENQFQRAFEEVKVVLNSSEIFIQSENLPDHLALDTFVRRKSGVIRKSIMYHEEILDASIFLPLKCQVTKDSHVRVHDFKGTICLKGVISSRIWCNPKILIGDVKKFVRTDILRSIAARIQLYCDGLTEPNITGDAMFISEPPRRVYFNVPDNIWSQPVQFSEYIFRGEAPTVAIAQAKQILDVDVKTNQIIEDLEGLPDDDAFMDLPSDGVNLSDVSLSQRELSRKMYMVGIVVALAVLAISMFMNYIMSGSA